VSHDNRSSGKTLLRAEGLTKSFGATTALADFDIRVAAGEIHALVGENGAGKSTFIKILAGLYAPDRGSLEVAGGKADNTVAFIHQDLGLVPGMSIADNLMLGLPYPRRAGLLHWGRIRRFATQSLDRVGADLDVRADVADLSTAERALVAIARALRLDAQVLVLDEPTANLPGDDVETLFGVLRGLREQGVGILYVSHRLREVLTLCDSVTVLRDGRTSYDGPATDLNERRLIEYMTGVSSTRGTAAPRGGHAEGSEVLLSVADFSAAGTSVPQLQLRAGEILGCVGLRGAGQERLGRAIFGLTPYRGELRIGGSTFHPRSPGDALARGVSFVSGDRDMTLVEGMSLRENYLMCPRYSPDPGWFRSPRSDRGTTGEMIRRFNVRPGDPDKPITELSGGNAQKVVFGRGLGSSPSVVVLEEPTAGVDMPTRYALYDAIRDEVAADRGFLLTSSDHDEVADVCDRIHVFREGRIVTTLDQPPFDPEVIASLSAGDHV
jgi:ribose transport system ATP-binding protein